jgi:hypothetical protein
MRHIERDECKVITLKKFHRERAERALEKDAMEVLLNTREAGSVIYGSAVGERVNNGRGPSTNNDHSSEGENPDGGVSLLDSTQPGIEYDWNNQPIIIPATSHTSGSRILDSAASALDKFPPLPTQNSITLSRRPTEHSKASTIATAINTHLLDIDETTDQLNSLSMTNKPKPQRWTGPNQTNTLFPQSGQAFPKTDPTNLYEDFSEISFRTDGTARESIHLPTAHPTIPPPGTPQNLDPNAPHSHITTTTTITKPSTLSISKFYDPLREAYECPGSKCHRLYTTPEDFRDHLLGEAHVGGHVTCPSCLNRFKSNAALVAHMESGSRWCTIRHSSNFNQVLREVSAGLLGTGGHLLEGDVRYIAPGDEGWD